MTRRGPDAKLSTEQPYAFPHACQAEAIGPHRRLREKADAIVGDLERRALTRLSDSNPDLGGPGVLLDVVEAFLGDPVEGECVLAVEVRILGYLDPDLQGRPGGHLTRQALERRAQAQVVEDRGVHPVGQGPDGGREIAEPVPDRLGSPVEPRICGVRERLLDGLNLLAQGGDLLAHIIVQITRDAAPVLLDGVDLSGGVGAGRGGNFLVGDDHGRPNRDHENGDHARGGEVEGPKLCGLLWHLIP